MIVVAARKPAAMATRPPSSVAARITAAAQRTPFANSISDVTALRTWSWKTLFAPSRAASGTVAPMITAAVRIVALSAIHSEKPIAASITGTARTSRRPISAAIHRGASSGSPAARSTATRSSPRLPK